MKIERLFPGIGKQLEEQVCLHFVKALCLSYIEPLTKLAPKSCLSIIWPGLWFQGYLRFFPIQWNAILLEIFLYVTHRICFIIGQSGVPQASCLNLRNVLMYRANSPPSLDLGLYWVVSSQWYTSYIFVRVYPSFRAVWIFGIHHVQVNSFSSSEHVLYMGFDSQYPHTFDIKEISPCHSTYKEGLDDTVPLKVAFWFWQWRNSPWCPQSLSLSRSDDLRDTDNTCLPRDRD